MAKAHLATTHKAPSRDAILRLGDFTVAAWQATRTSSSTTVEAHRVADETATVGLQVACGAWQQEPGRRGSATLLTMLLQRAVNERLTRHVRHPRWLVDSQVGRTYANLWVQCETAQVPVVARALASLWNDWPDLRRSFGDLRDFMATSLRQTEALLNHRGYAALAAAVHGADHPLGGPREGTANEVAELTPAQVEALWARAALSTDPHLTVASRLEPEEVLAQVGGGPTPVSWSPPLPAEPRGAPPGDRQHQQLGARAATVSSQRARVLLGRDLPVTAEWTPSPLLMFDAIYGRSDSAANIALRHAHGMSYTISGALERSVGVGGQSTTCDVGVSWDCEAGDVDRALDALGTAVSASVHPNTWQRSVAARLTDTLHGVGSSLRLVRHLQGATERGEPTPTEVVVRLLGALDLGPDDSAQEALAPDLMHSIILLEGV